MHPYEKLFSYGTLQYSDVQRATFGRTLKGVADALPNYRIDFITIDDPDVVAISKAASHPILYASQTAGDTVSGMVFEVTAKELAHADSYEVAAYTRVRVTLQSGVDAWAYVSVED